MYLRVIRAFVSLSSLLLPLLPPTWLSFLLFYFSYPSACFVDFASRLFIFFVITARAAGLCKGVKVTWRDSERAHYTVDKCYFKTLKFTAGEFLREYKKNKYRETERFRIYPEGAIIIYVKLRQKMLLVNV